MSNHQDGYGDGWNSKKSLDRTSVGVGNDALESYRDLLSPEAKKNLEEWLEKKRETFLRNDT